jgi:hypothetical protein
LDGFVEIINREKKKRYDEIGRDIGLTFDSILDEERKKNNDFKIEEISW